MSWKKFIKALSTLGLPLSLFMPPVIGAEALAHYTREEVIQNLGWIPSDTTRCGGYYSEAPFTYPEDFVKKKLMEITSTGPALFAQHGTSELQGHVTITQLGQQAIANKALLYRDPKTSQLVAIDLFGNVHLREPDTLIVANKAHFDLVKKTQALNYLLYRTAIYSNTHEKPGMPSNEQLQKSRQVSHLSAWGRAYTFQKNEPGVYELERASYTTCPPDTRIWKVRAEHIILNKNTGRGIATHARLYIKDVPVFYTPYLNFPIDDRRQTGFLFPSIGNSNWSGPYIGTPFYWNIAPNYDSTITPIFSGKSGLQINDVTRYITHISSGAVTLSVIPSDKVFAGFQTQMESRYNQPSSSEIQLADLRRLQNFSTTRGALAWKDDERFNDHLSTHVDYSLVSDDYYLRNYRFNLTETTLNQLLQQAEVDYKQTHWDWILRVQQYQTLHPVDDLSPTLEQYTRFPQINVSGNYPDQRFGLDYFVMSDVSHFDIRHTPGIDTKMPMGNRMHVQPGISLPINYPYFYVTPRLQFALTQYEIGHVSNTGQRSLARTIPIFDVASSVYFDRETHLFGYDLQQTLEPQVYYSYIPYHRQTNIPDFDTTLNTLTYDQLFTYNRFSGLDRIGDANQVGVGISTRFLDANTGAEKIRAGIGEIFYFANRRVTLCTTDNPECLDPTTAKDNTLRRSPISGILTYNLNPGWSLTANTIWNTQINQVENQSMTLSYAPDDMHAFSLGYNYVRNGDVVVPNAPPGDDANNLKQANLAFAWPVFQNWSVIGQVTKSINRNYFQNVVYGLQYDSCCWAVRFVGGKVFSHLDPLKNNNPDYDKQFYVQFALRGLGNIGSGDPSQFISSHTGHTAEFGQDY